jgi:predicted acetyltransferase
MIRKANRSDLPVLKELWYECFLEHDSKASIDYYFSRMFRLDKTFVLEIDNQIRTSLQLNQHPICFNGRIEMISFVVGVATFKKDRGNGYMKELLNYAISYAKDVLEQNFMILQAYNWDLYRPFGFYDAYYKRVITLKPKKLEKAKIIKLRDFDPIIMEGIYQVYTHKLDGFRFRNEMYYNYIHNMMLIDKQKLALSNQAYAYYSVENNELLINENAYFTYNDLLNLIKTIIVDNSLDIDKIIINTNIKKLDDKNNYLFMMVKDLNGKFEIKDNNYISEWI